LAIKQSRILFGIKYGHLISGPKSLLSCGYYVKKETPLGTTYGKEASMDPQYAPAVYNRKRPSIITLFPWVPPFVPHIIPLGI